MVTAIILLVLLIVLARTAMRRNVESRDGVDSLEWEKRLNRYNSPHH